MKAMCVLSAGVVLFVGTLTACQSWPSRTPDHPAPHRGAGASAGSSGAGGMATASGAGEKAGIGSWFGMCEMNRQITNARTPAERQALIDQMMPNMSQASRNQHLQMMQENCR